MSDLDACDKGRQFCPQVVNGEFQREAMRHVLGKTLSNNLWFKFEISCLKIGKVLLTECYVYWMKHLLVSSNIFKLLTHILLTIWMRYLCSVIVSTEKLFWVLKWQKAKRTNTKWKLWQFSNNCWRKMKTECNEHINIYVKQVSDVNTVKEAMMQYLNKTEETYVHRNWTLTHMAYGSIHIRTVWKSPLSIKEMYMCDYVSV